MRYEHWVPVFEAWTWIWIQYDAAKAIYQISGKKKVIQKYGVDREIMSIITQINTCAHANKTNPKN